MRLYILEIAQKVIGKRRLKIRQIDYLLSWKSLRRKTSKPGQEKKRFL